ncbi:uncharacterized protein LOC135336793 [Halichondria panicea]|uniref:uncharacterized protein LOC135336793 n=1 Tax=Halichondria panicea TaxID=6063 RepID=UPI00312B8011
MYLTCACTTVDSDLYGMSSQRLDLHLGLSEENPFTHSREEELSSDSTGGPKEVREFEMEIVDTRNDVDLGSLGAPLASQSVGSYIPRPILHTASDPMDTFQRVLNIFEVLKKHSMSLLSKPTLEELKTINNIYSQRSMQISFFGLHNTGKTTLINTLLGNRILPENMMNESSVTVRIRSHQDTYPLLLVEIDNDEWTMVHHRKGADSIQKTIKKLNEHARKNKIIPDSVVVSVSAPELFGRVEEGWQAFLLDNPGFGEDNKCVQQVAMAAVAPSAAYVFLTTVDSIGGTVNADFFRDLKSRDKSAFSDGRLIVVLTKMDMAYLNMDGSDVRKPEELIKAVCEKISEATNIPNVRADIVLPISCRWYEKSRKLADAYPDMEERHRDNAIRSLFDYPYLEVEATGQGISRNQALFDLPSSQIVKCLEDASGVPLLKERLGRMMSDTCVSTWRTKVLVGFQGCLIHAVDELERHADRLRRLIKTEGEKVACVKPVVTHVIEKKEELSHYLSVSTQKRVCEELEERFDVDLSSSTLSRIVDVVVKNLFDDFQKKCAARIQDPMDAFGPSQFDSDLEMFLQQASTSIESVINNSFIFEALPHALVTWNDQVEYTYRELCLRANNLYHTVRKSDKGGAPQSPEALADRSHVQNPAKLRSNLGDLKSEIYIPPVSLSSWEKFKKFIKLLFVNGSPEILSQGAQQMRYKSMDVISDVFLSLKETLGKVCLEYIARIKPTAVKHHHSKYEKKVEKCLSDFKKQYAAIVTEAEGYVRKLEKRKESHRKQLCFSVYSTAECKEIDHGLKQHLA